MIANKDKMLSFRVSEEEKKYIEEMSIIMKKRKGEFMRDIILKECSKLEKKHGRLTY